MLVGMALFFFFSFGEFFWQGFLEKAVFMNFRLKRLPPEERRCAFLPRPLTEDTGALFLFLFLFLLLPNVTSERVVACL